MQPPRNITTRPSYRRPNGTINVDVTVDGDYFATIAALPEPISDPDCARPLRYRVALPDNTYHASTLPEALDICRYGK